MASSRVGAKTSIRDERRFFDEALSSIMDGRQGGHGKGQSLARSSFGNTDNITFSAIFLVHQDRPGLCLNGRRLGESIDFRTLSKKS
jgi:hypothetical protein